MNKQHKLNLVRLALHLLRKEKNGMIDGRRFNMSLYFYAQFKEEFGGTENPNLYHEQKENLCNTSCCAIGEWILLTRRKLRAPNTIGCSRTREEDFGKFHDFLFAPYHPNCVKLFAERALIVLLYKNEEELLPEPRSKRQLIKELTEYRTNLLHENQS